MKVSEQPGYWMNWGQLLEALQTAKRAMEVAFDNRYLLPPELGGRLESLELEIRNLDQSTLRRWHHAVDASKAEAIRARKKKRSTRA